MIVGFPADGASGSKCRKPCLSIDGVIVWAAFSPKAAVRFDIVQSALDDNFLFVCDGGDVTARSRLLLNPPPRGIFPKSGGIACICMLVMPFPAGSVHNCTRTSAGGGNREAILK